MSITPWQPIDESITYTGRIFQVRRDRMRSPVTGMEHPFDVLVTPDWVNVVALTASDRVILIRQYRVGTRDVTLEIPGGCMDPGETPLEAAVRELREETGFESDRWSLIGRVEPNPAFQPNTTFTYLAEDARRVGPPRFDENELIEMDEHALSDIPRLVSSGAIRHALVICAFFHLATSGRMPMGQGRPKA